MKKIFVLGLSLMLFINTYGQSFFCRTIPTKLEEKFEYGVSWSFFQLGTITISVERILLKPELKIITVDIRSAPLIPFVNVDEHNVVLMNMKNGFTINYYATEELDGEKIETTCSYNQENSLIIFKERNVESKTLIKSDTLSFDKPYLVGSSLMHYIRLIADSGLVTSVPTMVGGNFYNTELNYGGAVEFTEIGAFDEPIRSFRFDGSAKWDGEATEGLSGDFGGWLSDDNESVVLKAEMEITLGSIDVELEERYKPGWIPPTAQINILSKNN
jgi:hypothetical protein